MPTSTGRHPIESATPLAVRIQALEDFAELADRMMTIGELKWAAVEGDFRLLAINAALRRQAESIRAAALLSRHGLGHLAVAFVRASPPGSSPR
jgi:hypothetical protein